MSAASIVSGIDVGGVNKGFHAVLLRNSRVIGKLSTRTAAEVVAWCRMQGASAIGVDAPCQWSLTGRARPCERELAALGIAAFSTPSQAVGEMHPFYGWMLNGARLYQELASEYPLYYDGHSPTTGPFCFETFPQAIACVLSGKRLSAKHKRTDRPRVLREAGIATDALTSIDEIDAALCALAAQQILAGRFKPCGDAAEGFILLPSSDQGRRYI